VIEVSDSSLRLDRRKAAIYAASGVLEYWLVNLPERQIEVHRRPIAQERRYDEVLQFKHADVVAPLARPEAKLNVSDLFG
jgi:Uma2 family endonuclease